MAICVLNLSNKYLTDDSLPQLLGAFEQGMPARRAADQEGTLVFMGHTVVGEPMNRVIELWRYPSARAAYEGQVAAEGTPTWRSCFAAAMEGVGSSSTSYLHASKFSPFQ